MVNNDIKNYFDFLIYIGVTSDETSDKINQLLLSRKYNDISNNHDLLPSLTCDYLKSLDKKHLELIGKNIYKQYMINKLKSELKIVKKLFIIRHNFFKRKEKKYFNKWRLLTINSYIYTNSSLKETSSYKSIKTRSDSKKIIFNTKNFLDKLDFYNDKKKENTEKIKLISETNLTNECTFKPTLKSNYKRSSSKKNIGNNDNKIKKKCKNNELDSLKILFDDFMNENKNRNYEGHKTIRNDYSYKKIKENNINNKKVENNFFSKRKQQTSGKKRKKTFKT